MLTWLKRLLARIQAPDAPCIEAANLQGDGKRAYQEDAFAFVNALDPVQYREHGMMFCVCDGMGGMKGGRLASETAVKSLRACFAELDCGGDIAQQLRDGLHAASAKVAELLDGQGGTTAVMGVVYQGQLYFVSVGDSYLWLLRDGRLIRLNTEHNVCHLQYLEAIRNGRLDPAAGRLHAESAALTSFLGMAGCTVAVDGCVAPLPLADGDIIVACSDGVSGVLEPAALANALNAPSVQQMCRNIGERVEECAHPYQDNYTALVIGYNFKRKR